MSGVIAAFVNPPLIVKSPESAGFPSSTVSESVRSVVVRMRPVPGIIENLSLMEILSAGDEPGLILRLAPENDPDNPAELVNFNSGEVIQDPLSIGTGVLPAAITSPPPSTDPIMSDSVIPARSAQGAATEPLPQLHTPSFSLSATSCGLPGELPGTALNRSAPFPPNPRSAPRSFMPVDETPQALKSSDGPPLEICSC